MGHGHRYMPFIQGVVASNFVELPGFDGEESGWFYIMDRKLVHWHSLIQFALAPHRMVCGRLMSCNEDLNEDGYVPYTNYLARLHAVSAEKQSALFTVAALSFLANQCILFALIEVFMQHAFASCLLLVIGVTLRKWFHTKKEKSNLNPKAKII